MTTLMPLTAMAVGQSAVVAHIHAESALVDRLREIGVRPGAEIQMLQRGSPCVVRLDGQKLCLRADELISVMVQAEGGDA